MRLTATFIALAALAALPASAQTPPTPTLHVTSRETVVDITVTDAKGQPVHGLKQSDFTIKEDGKPQSIRSFAEFGRATPTAPQTPPKLPPNVYTNLQPPPTSGAVNIFLLDFVNSAPDCDGPTPPPGLICRAQALEMQRLMKQQVMKYLHNMPSGTRAAVIAMAWPASLRILQAVTADPALLSAAVDSLNYSTEPISKGLNKIPMTLESMNQLASVAAQIKGRKNLIWFTYGLAPMTEPEICNCRDLPDQFLRAFSNLTAARVTVYPVGARGVYIDGPKTAMAEVMSLENIAEAGGGLAYHDSNDLETGIAKAIANGSDYYTLSYVPPGTQYDGRHHSIDVKLNLDPAQPGLHLTYRNYYYAEDPAKMLPPPGLSLLTTPPAASAADRKAATNFAMSRNMPTSTQLLFDVKIEPSTEPPKPTDPPIMGMLDPKLAALSSRGAKPLTRYALLYLVPVQQIAFADGPDGTHIGSLDFDIAAYDTQGKLLTSLSQTMKLPLTADEYRQFTRTPFQFFQQLDLPPGQLFLRIGVFDGASNKTGTLEIPLTVPKP